MTTEEQTHGDIRELRPLPDTESDSGVVLANPNVPVALPETRRLIPDSAIIAGVVVLSLGAAYSLHEFVELCFAHADAANVIIPLLLYPLVQYGVKKFQEKRNNENSRTSSAEPD